MLRDLLDVYILVYLENTLIFFSIPKDHTKHVRAVCKYLSKLNFYLKHKKCALFLVEEEFLGQVVSGCGVSM